jgi:hypothetical protein
MPFFLACVSLILAQALFYSGPVIFDFILFQYVILGFWAVGFLGGLIDLAVSYLLRKKIALSGKR